MRKKQILLLNLAFFLLAGLIIGKIIQPGIFVWEFVQTIDVEGTIELEIVSPEGWSVDERWRIYTLDLAIDPRSSNRPVVALGHDGDLDLGVFRGLQHNDKFQVIEGSLNDGNKMVYSIPLSLLSDQPVRLWLWSGDTGYSFRVNGVELKEKMSWRLTEDYPYFYYTMGEDT